MNDVLIIGTIVSIFLLIGAALPFMESAYSVDQAADYDSGVVSDNIGQAASDVSPFDVLSSVFLMFFWTFGALPLFLELVFTVFRIILVVTIARNIWQSGG